MHHEPAKASLTPKFIVLFEELLGGVLLNYSRPDTQDTDPTADNPNFWEELFLLRVNVKWLSNWFDTKRPSELSQLQVCKATSHLLISHRATYIEL